MKYICSKEYVGKSLNGEDVSVPYGAEVDVDRNYLCYKDYDICRINSQAGHIHFALNDDDNGLERGIITYKLAREHIFTELHAQMLLDNYRYLLQSGDFINFNNDFYITDIETLRAMADDFGITYEVKPVPVKTFTSTPLKSASIQNFTLDSDTTVSANSLDSDTSVEVSLQQIADTLDTIIAHSEVS